MFIDCLYGHINIPIENRIISCPEVQRLRGIRLCNINSPYITGADTLNRFEHAIGTAYLASNISHNLDISPDDKHAFLLASLLHDIVTAPFGHSLEYLFETLKSKEYEHANIWKMFLTGKSVPTSRNIYFGRKQELQHHIKSNIMDIIIKILQKEHFLTLYLDNDIDIDNIDNVFRFAFHIGIQFDKCVPVKLANSLYYCDSKLNISREDTSLFNEWFRVREELYQFLLENNGEFVAKALLERCFIEGVKDDIIDETDWILTDYEMANMLFSKGSPIIKKYIQKLMHMEFPTCSKIFYCTDVYKVDSILSNIKLELIESAYKNNVFLHFIRDVNKTRRTVDCHIIGDIGNNESQSNHRIGYKMDRYLIGFFSDNGKSIDKSVNELVKCLDIELLPLRSESGRTSQISLFEN